MKSYKPFSIKMLSDKSGKYGIPTRTFGNRKNMGAVALILGAVIVGAGFMFGGDAYKWVVKKATGGKASSLSDVGLSEQEKAAQQSQPTNIQVNMPDARAGVSSAVTLKWYDSESLTQSAISPASVWIFDKDGSKLVNGATGNSTTTTKPNELAVYVGGTDYYMLGNSPKAISLPVTTEAPTFSDVNGLKLATMASESSMVMACYDSDINVLTADDNATNTADYSYAMGASAEKVVWCKLTNNDDYSVYKFGAAATAGKYNTTGVDSMQIVSFKFNDVTYNAKEVSMPKQLRDASIVGTNDVGSTSTVTGYSYLYRPVDSSGNEVTMDLHAYDELWIKTKVKAGTSDPVANGFNLVSILAIDASYAADSTGKPVFDIYRHDTNQRVTEVGLSDTTTSPQGLTTGALIELT